MDYGRRDDRDGRGGGGRGGYSRDRCVLFVLFLRSRLGSSCQEGVEGFLRGVEWDNGRGEVFGEVG